MGHPVCRGPRSASFQNQCPYTNGPVHVKYKMVYFEYIANKVIQQFVLVAQETLLQVQHMDSANNSLWAWSHDQAKAHDWWILLYPFVFLGDIDVFAPRPKVTLDDLAKDLLVDREGHSQPIRIADLVFLQPH